VTDVESFLLKTLKDVRLSNAASCEKDAILKKIKTLQDSYPQLRQYGSDWNNVESTTTTTTTTTITTPALDSSGRHTKQPTGSDDSGGDDEMPRDSASVASLDGNIYICYTSS